VTNVVSQSADDDKQPPAAAVAVGCDESDADADDDAASDYVMVDKLSVGDAAADKNVNKLLKFVADNDIQMVSVFPDFLD